MGDSSSRGHLTLSAKWRLHAGNASAAVSIVILCGLCASCTNLFPTLMTAETASSLSHIETPRTALRNNILKVTSYLPICLSTIIISGTSLKDCADTFLKTSAISIAENTATKLSDLTIMHVCSTVLSKTKMYINKQKELPRILLQLLKNCGRMASALSANSILKQPRTPAATSSKKSQATRPTRLTYAPTNTAWRFG